MDLPKGGLRVLGALAALWLGAPLFMPGCSTGAVGIDACRAIESARCDAAPTCFGDSLADSRIETEEQVANCRVFYNDHCLVGLENTDAEPDQNQTDKCVAAVAAVAKCKRDGAVVMDECRDAEEKQYAVEGQAGLSPCEILQEPELLEACAFVAATTEDEDE